MGEYKTRSVLLCLGRGGTPRKLGVPGEDHTKVDYRLIDSREFAGKSVLVVGGGDSALEAAHTIAEEKGSTVTLSYREKAFTRAKEKNRKKVEEAAKEGRLNVLFESKVKAVHDASVDIEKEGKVSEVPNDAVICRAGGILPTALLEQSTRLKRHMRRPEREPGLASRYSPLNRPLFGVSSRNLRRVGRCIDRTQLHNPC